MAQEVAKELLPFQERQDWDGALQVRRTAELLVCNSTSSVHHVSLPGLDVFYWLALHFCVLKSGCVR